jgi:hypothetical protein
LVTTLALFLVGSLVVACTQQGDGSGSLDGEALTKERCSTCHDLQRVENAKKSPEEWKANVERMVGIGAKLNDAEQMAVIEYLSETYPK